MLVQNSNINCPKEHHMEKKSKIIVRAFTFPSDLREEHSYCVGSRLVRRG